MCASHKHRYKCMKKNNSKEKKQAGLSHKYIARRLREVTPAAGNPVGKYVRIPTNTAFIRENVVVYFFSTCQFLLCESVASIQTAS